MEITAQLDEETIRKLQQIQQQTNQDQAEILKAAIADYYDRLQPDENNSSAQEPSKFKNAIDIFEEVGFINCGSNETVQSTDASAAVRSIIRKRFEQSREP